ncbi:HalOD1 output domain-containing protein [Natrononativus amylolyticus]|uniref:HalOD1 output domain-containing protein n=1 Tax=Natrononativus amylolyticus TaxID=2963434 RepID=UPI0020CB8D3C|nr:HalOD1 output domain-containing protein [Natrononativus amylolyticus]
MTNTRSSVSQTAGTQYAVQYDRLDDEPLSVAIADAVAAFDGTDVTELEPLHYAINADALERLFEPRADGLRANGSVTFEYSEYLITVTAAGEITVEAVDQ